MTPYWIKCLWLMSFFYPKNVIESKTPLSTAFYNSAYWRKHLLDKCWLTWSTFASVDTKLSLLLSVIEVYSRFMWALCVFFSNSDSQSTNASNQSWSSYLLLSHWCLWRGHVCWEKVEENNDLPECLNIYFLSEMSCGFMYFIFVWLSY